MNENSVFDLDAPDMAMFEKFSEKMKETIQGSREWRARSSSGRPQLLETSPQRAPSGFEDMDDDIPSATP